jgi:hypothetical protein
MPKLRMNTATLPTPRRAFMACYRENMTFNRKHTHYNVNMTNTHEVNNYYTKI